jgi:hypothetical protein
MRRFRHMTVNRKQNFLKFTISRGFDQTRARTRPFLGKPAGQLKLKPAMSPI